MCEDPTELWERECELARRHVLDWPAPLEQGEQAIEAAQRLLAVAHILKGVACETCQGFGVRSYASTAGWMGGAGGQSFTVGVCDKCWGTGRNDQTGVNRRHLLSDRRTLEGIWVRLTTLVGAADPEESEDSFPKGRLHLIYRKAQQAHRMLDELLHGSKPCVKRVPETTSREFGSDSLPNETGLIEDT